ncbi:MAG: dihydropteroate synthase [Gammaproteobacteria bacterium]|nr:dihydropteroate synthase [Gammaproteobacteria bacterium]
MRNSPALSAIADSTASISIGSLGKIIKIRNKILDLTKPNIMGVLNITPDSFSDGGKYFDLKHALRRVEEMVTQGVDIIDVGAESSRPGAIEISAQEELDRLCPILEKIVQEFSILVSVDTYKPKVMEEVIKLKVDIINDIRALRERDEIRDGLNILAAAEIPVILMHMQGKPRNMQRQPRYEHVFTDVFNFFQHRIEICRKFGIKRQNILLDPGFGFGKTWFDNASLLKYLNKFQELGCPLVVGLSRKSMIEKNMKGSVAIDDRLCASIALATMAIERGAGIIRCHDVKATRQAIDLVYAILEDGNCIDE